MKYLILLIATALFYYLIGAFIYGSFNSVLWDHEGKIGLSFCFGMTALFVIGFTAISDHNKEI